VETPELREPWQAVALEKLVGLLTTNAGMDLVSLAVAVGAQHSVAALCQHWAAQRRAAEAQRASGQPRPTNGHRQTAQQGNGHRQPAEQEQKQQHGQLYQQPPNGPLYDYVGHPVVAQLLEWASTPQGERFVVRAMAAAATHSTRAYMESLGAGTTYDDIFAAALAPRHREALKELTVMATREAVATYLCPPPQHRVIAGGSATTRHQQSTSWSATLRSVGNGTAFVIKQVSNNSRAAAIALPVVVLATSRGLALGCRDAVARLRADPSAATPFEGSTLGFAPARAVLFDGVRGVLCLALCVLAALVLSFLGVRHLMRADSMALLHH
jgi:hypothetical protein